MDVQAKARCAWFEVDSQGTSPQVPRRGITGVDAEAPFDDRGELPKAEDSLPLSGGAMLKSRIVLSAFKP